MPLTLATVSAMFGVEEQATSARLNSAATAMVVQTNGFDLKFLLQLHGSWRQPGNPCGAAIFDGGATQVKREGEARPAGLVSR